MRLSIRSKLTVAFILVLLPFLFLEFFNIRERTASGKQAILENLTGSAQTAAATMDGFIAEVIRKEQSAAQVVSSERSLSAEDLSSALAQIRAPGAGGTFRVLPVPVLIPKLETLGRSLQPFALYLAYLDSQGRVVAADPASLIGSDMSTQPEVKAVLQGQVWADSGFKADIAPGSRENPGFAICLGVRTGGQQGSVCAGIEALSLRDILPPPPSGGQTVILDSQGWMIYSSQTAEPSTPGRDWTRLPFIRNTVSGQPTSVEDFVSPADGQRYIGGQTRISSLGWLMGVYRPLHEALAPVQAATHREIVLLACIVVMAVTLAQVLGALLVQPIVELTAHARHLSQGDLGRRIAIASGDEMQALGETFNVMAGSLNQTINDLTAAKQEIARQSQELQQLLVRTNAVQEDERRRIAFDIHDGVIQLLIGAGYELQAASRSVGNGNVEEARRKLERARQLMDQTVGEMRRIVFDLHPTSLESVGLFPSLERYGTAWQETAGITCSVAVEGEPGDLPAESKVGIYRIVQEALTNIRRHAGATRVDVRARVAGDTLIITIEDNGRGFSLDDVKAASGHLGLMSMSERARTLGGRLDIQSAPGRGTRLVLEVPVAGQADGERVTQDVKREP